MSAVMEHGGGPVQRLAHPARAISLYDLFRRQPAEYLCPGRSLFVEGDDAAHVFEVLDGALRVFKSVSDGRRVITGFMYPGDIVGVSLGKRYLGSVESVCGSTVRRLPRSRLDAALEADKRIRPMVFSLVTDEMAAAQRQMILLSCKNSEERLCSFLLEYLNRSAFPGERFPCLNLPMCRQDIADYLGLTIETVSRAITKLIDKGVLQIENAAVRQTITIAKPLLLAQIAGEGAPSMPTAEEVV